MARQGYTNFLLNFQDLLYGSRLGLKINKKFCFNSLKTTKQVVLRSYV